jgi:hypothetical protein
MKGPILMVSLAILISGAASAQEPKVRSTLAKQDDLWVGQRIPFVVELLAPGFFSGTASFDLPNPPGMILMPPVSSPTVGSEEIDGVSYTVQRYELAVLARRAGEQTIPAFPVRFSFKRQPLEKETIPATGKTEPLKFSVKLPPGAEKLGSILSARGLQVVESWKPEPGKSKAGDAFTRTITYSAPDVPAMAFPPFPTGRIDGLGIYPKPPEVLDRSVRGDLQGKRIDSFTYVCQRPGQFVIPATRLTWFDLDTRKLQTIEFPARTLDVAPNAALASTAPERDSFTMPWKSIGWAALIIGALTILVRSVGISRMKDGASNFIALFRPVHLPPLNPTPPR